MRAPPSAPGEALWIRIGLALNGCCGRRDSQSIAFFSDPGME